MSERVRKIQFQHFRGLPDYECTLNGRSILILGGNGKGKSAIVDGLEFLFGARISRFHGEGSGPIDADAAMRNVHTMGEPSVAITFTPTNETVSRSLGQTSQLTSTRPLVREYLEKHPAVGAFVLRRSQILEFIQDQDAKRYQKYIRLLGLDWVDLTQRNFIEAEQTIGAQVSALRANLQSSLLLFRDPVTSWIPTDSNFLFGKCAEFAGRFAAMAPTGWEQLDEVLSALEAKRSKQTRERINALNFAIARLEIDLPANVETSVAEINEVHSDLLDLRATTSEVGMGRIIREGLTYFEENVDVTQCPLCEEPLTDRYSTVFSRLTERNQALFKLRALEDLRSGSFETLVTALQRIVDRLVEEKNDHVLYLEFDAQALSQHCDELEQWLDSVKVANQRGSIEQLVIPGAIAESRTIRWTVREQLLAERNALIQPDDSALERGVDFLQRAKEKHGRIITTEVQHETARRALGAIREAREAYSEAREFAIQQVFDQIAAKVLRYYRKLHDVCDDEASECTELKLEPTARAGPGGVRLIIDFLSKIASCDARAFLSEGHLDSLGLCLYLATVRIFNPPGCLLVLDDVLTSVDKDHRSRVAELLLEEFSDFQLILTTHDDHWFGVFQSKVQARAEQRNWTFNRIVRWTVEHGPESAAYEGTWDWIESHLEEDSYRELGGPLRLVLEDFLKRVGDKIELRVRYHIDGKYTSGDFTTAGIQEKILSKLVESDPSGEAEAKHDMQRVFGSGELINALSHDNAGRLEVTLIDARDFVTGLRSLTQRCQAARIMKGVGD